MGAAPAPLAVHAWPQQVHAALADLRSAQACTVISVPTPRTTDRVRARQLIRQALCHTLAEFLVQAVASVRLASHPGQGLWLDTAQMPDAPRLPISLSVSHAPGISVAALGWGVAVGVDVMTHDPDAPTLPDWARVAQDYLGPGVTEALRQTASDQRSAAFAQAWTRAEASLKCLRRPLTEWTPALAQQLAVCRLAALALPEPVWGSLAIQ